MSQKRDAPGRKICLIARLEDRQLSTNWMRAGDGPSSETCPVGDWARGKMLQTPNHDELDAHHGWGRHDLWTNRRIFCWSLVHVWLPLFGVELTTREWQVGFRNDRYSKGPRVDFSTSIYLNHSIPTRPPTHHHQPTVLSLTSKFLQPGVRFAQAWVVQDELHHPGWTGGRSAPLTD